MIFHIHHITRYQFSEPVFLEPHAIRLRPLGNTTQHLADYRLEIEPSPSQLTEYTDAAGNDVAQAWFAELTDQLTITTISTVATHRTNPFDYLLDPAAAKLPLAYDPSLTALLAPYRVRQTTAETVAAYAREMATQAGGDTHRLLAVLCDHIYRTCQAEIRDEGDPFPAEQTLATHTGSCRDFAVLFMEVCRVLGLAARFASGYQEGDPDQTHRHLHAWPEVYLPGGGWRGYDPTHGLVVADAHVVVAVAADPREAAPVTGSFRRTGATGQMTAELSIRVEK